MGLIKIKELMHFGKYNEALDAIVKLGQEDILEGIIFKSRILELKGEPKKALEVAEQALKESLSRGTKLHQLQAFINLGYAHLALRNIPELTNAIHEGEKILSIKEIPLKDFKKEAQGSLAYLQGHLTYLKGDVHQALDQLEKSLVIRQALDNQHEIVDTLTALGFIHLDAETGKKKLALDYFKRSLSLSEISGNKTAIAHSLNRVGCYYAEINNNDQALSYYEKSLALYQELENKMWMAGLYNNISLIYNAKENFDLALNYLERSLITWQELEDKDSIALAYLLIGYNYLLKGDLDRALDYYQRSFQLFEEVGNKFKVILSLLNIGDIHLRKGDLNSALNQFNKSLVQGKETNSKIHIAWASLRLASIYAHQGELEKALNTINRSLNTFIEVDSTWGIIWSHSELGIIKKLQGKYELSLKYLEKALDLTKQTVIGGNPTLPCSYFLFHLILLAQELDSSDIAEEYLKQLHELQQKSENKHVNLRTRFAEAIVLKMSKRGVKKLQAQQKFQAIINEEILDFNITTLAMLNLCELLILEIKISETAEDLLQEVTTLSDKFYEVAQNQKSSLLTVMALLLKTKLALVRGKVEKANGLLSDAKKIASEKKLRNLLSKVKIEQETVQSELNKWDELIQRKASIQERIEQARIANYIVEAKQIQEAWMRPSTEMINQ